MKTQFSSILAAASLLGTAAVFAQSATTDPVGFVSSSASANSDAPIGLPLHRAPVLQSIVSTVAGNVITLNAALTANQLVYQAGVQPNHYYAYVKFTTSPSSAVRGKWYEVLTNTAHTTNGTITVEPGESSDVQTQGLLAGDTIEIIPFWTLNTLFPNGQGVTATADIDVPQDLVLLLPQTVPGTNLTAAKSSLYSTDLVNLPSAGWYDANAFNPVGDDVVAPDTYIIVRNKGDNQPFTLVGGVPMGGAKTTNLVRLSAGVKQDNYVVNPFPIPLSLPELNLFESGVFEATSDIDAPKDVLLVYQGTESGFDSQPLKAYIYSTDTVNLGVAGWYDASSFLGPYTSVDKLVPAGAGMIVRKAAGVATSVTWTIPKPY